MKITEKEFNAQMDRVNGEEPEEDEERTVIIDELYLMTMQSKNTTLRTALNHLVEVIEAHDLESLSCDSDGQHFCDCLSLAVKQAKEAIGEQ